MAGTLKVFGEYSTISTTTTPPVAPVIKAVSKNIETITVSWTKVLGATQYVLYVNGAEHTTISDANAISVDVSSLTLGESYSFSLVAKNGALSSTPSTSVSSIPVPAAVNNFKISDTNLNRFSLSWDAVNGADHYDVYQGTTSTAVTTKVGSVTEPSFTTLSTLNFNTSYFYKVVPVTLNGISGFSSAIITGKTTLKEPSSLTVTSPNATTSALSWSVVEGAAGYEVYYAKAGTTTYTFLKSVTTLTADHTGLTANTTYNYKVRAYRMAGTLKVYGEYSTISTTTTPPVAPVIKAVSKNIETITVSWTKVLGATQYVLYVNGAEHTTISDANAISVDVSSLTLGESYSFSLVAKNGALSSTPSTSVSSIPVPAAVNNFKISDTNLNRFSLSWDAVNGADHYDVYQGTTSTAVTTKVGSVTEPSFTTLSTLNFNTSYFYKVVPVTLNGISGFSSAIITGKTTLKEPSSLTVTSPNATTSALSWSVVEGAAGYEVYYAKAGTTTYTFLKSVTTLTADHTGLTANTTYNYKVRAYRMAGTLKVYGEYSNVSIIIPFEAPVLKFVPIDELNFKLSWNSITGANEYIIYRYEIGSDVSNVQEHGRTTSLETTISLLDSNEAYNYFVKAANSSNIGLSSNVVLGGAVLDDVSNVVLSSNINGVNIVWDSMEYAYSYDVYLSLSASTIGTKIGNVTTNRFNTGPILNYGHIYYFSIVPVKSNGLTKGINLYTKKYSIKTRLEEPQNFEASLKDITSINLTWDSVYGADGYEVYSSPDQISYQLVKSSLSNSTELTGLFNNSNYIFKIRSFKKIGLENVYSSFTYSNSILTGLEVPTITLDYNSEKQLRLTINQVEGATRYEIYTSSITDRYKLDRVVESNLDGIIVLDFDYFEAGDYVGFRVVAKNDMNSSLSTEYLYNIAYPKQPKDLEVTGSGYNRINLSWSSVQGASKYDVYKRDPSFSSNFVKIGTTNVNNYEAQGLVVNKTYEFNVVALTNEDYSSNPSGVVSGMTKFDSVSNINFLPINSTTVKLSWNPVQGANSYNINQYNQDNVLISNFETGYLYSNITIEPGKDYKFAIRPLLVDYLNKKYGEFTYSEIFNYKRISEIQLNPSEITLDINETFDITANVLPLDASYPYFTYYSFNSNIANVDQYGRVTGLSTGSTKISIKSIDGVEVFLDVHVALKLSGTGNYTKEFSFVPYGFYKLNVTHSGDSSFNMKTFQYNDTVGKQIFNDQGDYSGSMFFGESHQYSPLVKKIEILTTGDWTIEFVKVKDESSTSNITGSVNKLTGWIPKNSSTQQELIDIVHEGEGDFSIWAHQSSGYSTLLFSGSGNINTSINYNLQNDFLLEFRSSGIWSIDFNRGDALTTY